VIPATTLKYVYERDMRIIYESVGVKKDETPDRQMVSEKTVTEFIDPLGALDENQKVCIERQVGEALTRGNKPTERTKSNRFDFMVLTPWGEAVSERSCGVDGLLWVMADLVFPVGGKIEGGKWTLERQAKEGRFDFSYAIQSLSDPVRLEGEDPRKCVRINVEARLPGGAPPTLYRLDRATGTIWFDKRAGVIVKAEAFLDTSPSSAPKGEASLVKSRLTRTLRSKYQVDTDEAAVLKCASTLFFGVIEMIQDRKYAKAIKTVDGSMDGDELHAKYRQEFIADLRAMIPEVRMSQQAGAAMRQRVPRAFRNIPWRRPERPPCFLIMDNAPRRPGQRRTIEGLEGKAAPGWLKEHAASGKKSLVYFAVGHLASSRSAAKLADKIAKAQGSSASVTGVLLEGENRKLWEFMFSLGTRMRHRIKLDEKMKALTEGKLVGVPAFFVVSASGKVLFAEVGYFGEATESEITKALR
jgi:hypothetical protein